MIDLTLAIRNENEFAAIADCMKKETTGGSRTRRPLVVSGLCEGAEFAFINNIRDLANECGYDGILLLVSDEKKANRLSAWLEECGKRTYVYTLRDMVFFTASASHEYEHERLSVLSGILHNNCDYVITTPDALLQYTIPKQRLENAMITVMPGDISGVKEISLHLEASGYHRSEIVESAGQYAVRGGIIDVFSPSYKNPVRIDFFGDEVDRLCYFDVMTQRRVEDCPCFEIMPAEEIIPDADAEKRVLAAITAQLRKHLSEPVSELLRKEAECIENGTGNASIDKYISLIYPEKQCLLDYASALLPVIVEPGAVMNRLQGYEELTNEQTKALIEEGSLQGKYADFGRSSAELENYIFEDFAILVSNMGSKLSGHRYSGLFTFRTKQTTGYKERFDLLCDDLRGYMAGGAKVKLICETDTSATNLEKMLCDSGFGAYKDSESIIQRPATVALSSGIDIPGFELISSKYVCLNELNEQTVIKRGSSRASRRKKDGNLQRILSYADLSEGDFIVHETHGIGQYLGMTSLTVDGMRRDYLKIKYDGSDMLYLPCEKLDRISKYIGKGAEDGTIKLSKMGGADWKKAKTRAKAAAKDMAKKLIALYAERTRKEGISFPKDDEMQREFESAFEFEETDCQLSASEDVKRDMEKRCPMDRLLCGDVGYGKTEVALRAAFKAVEGGYQVAILVPTTILCMQHYRTLLSRMRGFPVSVDMVCRFKSKKEIDESLRKLHRGETDIIVGTHRLLSKDVEFKKLGLLVVDEEQRFGVTHKEKLKELSKNVDVLTLSATPIPRTLNMAISGIRDMSILDEAPVDRLPVQTFVVEHDMMIIEEAIRRELRRGGQVFYLCNRIEKMGDVASKLAKAFPDVHIEIAHGQMDKEDLSDIWEEMVVGNVDILVSTTIIETGVDVPNANTLIIEDADKLGLSQLHQIRGRVGRSSRRAYAYFTYPSGKELSEISQKRLEAIKDFTEFGSGFRIAMRDMELRGVGNLLGAEQHGHMESIGYDLYMKLLSEAVLEEKGENIPDKTECTLELKIDAYIPEDYISNQNQRIDAYKKISLIENDGDLSDVYDELLDRYGEPPAPVLNILTVSHIRALGSEARFVKISQTASSILFYPEVFDAAKMTKIASLFNGRVLITLSGKPYAALRTSGLKSEQALKECVVFLKKYNTAAQNS